MLQRNEQGFLVSCFGNLLFGTLFINIFYWDVVILGNESNRFPKGQILFLHYKGYGITATVATETVE